MIKNIFFASLLSAGVASTAQAQSLSKSFDLNSDGANATLVGLGNVNVSKDGHFNIGPADTWSLKTGKVSKADWKLGVQYLGAGRDSLELGQSEFAINDRVVDVEYRNSILKYERQGSQIEQIIVIKKSPEGTGQLRASFSMSDVFSYELQKDGGFHVNQANQTLLEFGALTTKDATGRILPSRIEINGNVINYIVEDEGAVFPVTIDPIVSTPSVTVEGQNGGQLGFAFDSLDINNDGFEDLIVGEDRYVNGEALEGRIYLFLGSANGLSATAAWELESDDENGRFGARVRNLGDINGDGNEDFAIGSALSSKGSSFGGHVDVFLGDDLSPGTPVWSASGTTLIEVFGSDIAAGDFNCDGITDIAIASNFFNDGGTNNGKVQIYNGRDVIPYFAATSSFTKSFADGVEAGTSLAVGNINGDQGANTNLACEDLVVGRPKSDVGGTESGGFDIFFGAEAGPSTTPSSSHEGTESLARLGYSLAVGDINKDGFDDVVAGSYSADNNTDPNNMLVDAGRVLIFDGSAQGLNTISSTEILGSGATNEIGFSVALGDFDNNGFLDLVAGAPNPGGEGLAFVYLNGAGVPATAPAWSATTGGIDGRFGDSVTTGDFNNDGFSDLGVTAVTFNAAEGSFYVYDGRATCQIGDDVFVSGTVSGEGCGICDTARSTTAWSPLPRGTECGAPACSGEALVAPACDGNLLCTELATPTDCGAYACDARTDSCFDACSDDVQCETGAKCENEVCVSAKPTAVIGGPQSGACSDTITLSAAESTDPADAALTYTWSQIGTPDVLAGVDTTSEELSFVAPMVNEDTTLIFSLIVKNANLESDPVNYEVTIAGCAQMGDMADMGTLDAGTDSGTTDTGESDMQTADMGTTDLGQDSGNDGSLSGGGCGCSSSEENSPAGSALLIFILGFFAVRRRKRS